MGETTAIEWTGPNGKTWSPHYGCTKVHTGCLHCYAEADNARYRRNGGGWGPGAPRMLRKNWDDPVRWARAAAKAGQRWKVFPSLCDPFDAEAPTWEGQRHGHTTDDAPASLDLFADLIWGTARVCGECGPTLESGHDLWCSRPAAQQGGLDWLLLTKRPERAGTLGEHIRRLVWLLVSVSDQATADKYVPLVLAAEGYALRGVSYEPAVGPLHLRFDARATISGPDMMPPGRPGLDWVIVGGESGPTRRPFDVAWAQSVADQCSRAGVPVFIKQDSALYPGQQGRIPDALWARKEFPVVVP